MADPSPKIKVSQPAPGQERRLKGLPMNDDFAYLRGDTAYQPFAANDNLSDQRTTVDKSYRDTAYQDKLVQSTGQPSLGRRRREAANEAFVRQDEEQTAFAPSLPMNAVRPAPLGKAMIGDKADKIVGRLKARVIATPMLHLQFWVWLLVQLPFALMSVVALSIVGFLEGSGAPTDGTLSSWITSVVAAAANSVLSLLGIDILAIAMDLFIILYAIVLGFGIINILIVGGTFKILGMEPYFGSGSTIKLLGFLIAFVCYATPLLNLFPGTLLWVAAVWVNPRS